jgi:hypothetical protein
MFSAWVTGSKKSREQTLSTADDRASAENAAASKYANFPAVTRRKFHSFIVASERGAGFDIRFHTFTVAAGKLQPAVTSC